ncbi:ABC transporter permease [Bacillus mycoides]|uniref:ABC transporter permease n=1 Tax=Bacillus mycoides TaxID=1405 RepID=UPI0010BF461C|nr:ABC transporter permease [Bacillus mycoides]TKI27728.1 ABC transporter permease [Bacillus mycoides]
MGKYHRCDGMYRYLDCYYPIVNVNCCDSIEEKAMVRPSAFKAISGVDQSVAANTFVKVLYQNEQFDLANEYNPVTSTFIPLTKGVYNLIASVAFFPNVPGTPFKVFINFRINGRNLGGDSEFQGAIALSNIILTTDIEQLNARDIVEVFASATVPGTFFAVEDQTRFAVSRVPSPVN